MKLNDIMNYVCKVCNLSKKAVIGKSRFFPLVKARILFSTIARENKYTNIKISEFMNRRQSVISHYFHVQQQNDVKEEYILVKKLIEDEPTIKELENQKENLTFTHFELIYKSAKIGISLRFLSKYLFDFFESVQIDYFKNHFYKQNCKDLYKNCFFAKYTF